MGLEDDLRRYDELEATRKRVDERAAQEHDARIAELAADFQAALRKRGVAPRPVHAIRSLYGNSVPTPKTIGNGWIFGVSDNESSSWYVALLTDGSLRNAHPMGHMRPGQIKKFGITRKYWPQGDFIGMDESSQGYYGNIEQIKDGMMHFLRRG
ncbi:hypothetical protein Q5530_05480 [Saccharothrix sp. BKS2]|uniref:hypothetical protein n=1 Tax=Saccharothrix sp. BKS2 TaxID=3064400 RepID=UPI0039E825EC